MYQKKPRIIGAIIVNIYSARICTLHELINLFYRSFKLRHTFLSHISSILCFVYLFRHEYFLLMRSGAQTQYMIYFCNHLHFSYIGGRCAAKITKLPCKISYRQFDSVFFLPHDVDKIVQNERLFPSRR